MPVWHVSVARINGSFTRVLKVSEWSPLTMNEARGLTLRMLHGVGTTEWEREEIGDTAIHRRRRLNPHEIKQLYAVNGQCPVFTHGKAALVL